ncbi:uncharacterized protein [Ambystoma mexicanum]|uniref:uncharacterized protein n=1 Tax=Ambystoma mexicanum TaxID=8296 RepID=UPI0037E77BC1
MGSGGSAARGRRGLIPGVTQRRSSSSSGSSDPCRAPEEEPLPSRDVRPPGSALPRMGSPHSSTFQDQDEGDTDGELDKALADCEDVDGRHWADLDRRSPFPCAEAPGSSPLLIPSLQLEGTAAGGAQTGALTGRAAREAVPPGWALGPRCTPCGQEQHTGGATTELYTRKQQDVQNNNIPEMFQDKSGMPSDLPGPIVYDVSEEELMASIEREY